VDIRDARASTGRLVASSPAAGGREYGRITETAGKTVFVLHHGDRAAKGTRPADLELVTLDLRPGPADIAAAWVPPGASLTLHGITVETPDIELGQPGHRRRVAPRCRATSVAGHPAGAAHGDAVERHGDVGGRRP
jgi:hypothetical protein